MKKILLSLILSILVSNLFAGPKAPILDPIEFDLVQDQGEYNTFTVDPRIEVIAMICRLAEMPAFNYNYEGDNTFLSQMDSIFSKYKDHKAVKSVKALNKKGIEGDAFISLAYHIKPDFSGTVIDFSPFPETLFYSWKNIPVNTIYKLVKEIHQFALDTNFPRIYLLNRATYIANTGNMKKSAEKCGIAKWAKEFFMMDSFERPVLNVSQINVGCNYYDFVIGQDGKRLAYLTTFPGTYFDSFETMYICMYAQIFATENWPKIKENYSKYMRAWSLKVSPDNKKEIESREFIDYDFVQVIVNYLYLAYLKDVEPENHMSWEELYGYFEKQFADENIIKVWDLVLEYQANRDKYPTFLDFSEPVVNFINQLSFEE
ncbi:MAG: DUF4932 domain-containing protein [Treponema sp.]|nr:DUF4932 domain-containing protein [Treponema sp.]